MADFTIDAGQLRRLEKSLSKAGVDFKKGTKRFLTKIGVAVQGKAKEYSPESPTKSMYAAMNKSGVTKRKASSITTGSLRNSITMQAKSDSVSIFVPANSKAGEYAEKIHDKKGSAWQNRGPRTKQKGPKADEKFIYRAYADTKKEQDAFINQTIAELVRDIGV